MQTLARDVGSLSRVLNNVKTRGTLGEVQLEALLEQVLTPEQYGRNVETIPGSNARVDFAIRLPGRREDGKPMWLPIDCKFPRDDYERLLEAQENADKAGVEAAAKAIEMRPAQRGPLDPCEVHRDAAHDRLRHPVRADRRSSMRGAAAARAWSRRCSATTASRSPARPPCWRP
jgi:hypothetical protein